VTSSYKRANVTHDLKCWPVYFHFVLDLRKQFEIRETRERNFQVGDVLWLREWEPVGEFFTGRECHRLVTYLTDYEQKPGFVVMSLAEI
jgi:hypothetical protein